MEELFEIVQVPFWRLHILMVSLKVFVLDLPARFTLAVKDEVPVVVFEWKQYVTCDYT